MSLSGILASVPKHQTTLPLSGKKVEYRPFIVKEEKILLMAAETRNEKSIYSAIREVVLSCTGGKIDVTKIPILDMEYLFLQLRSQSVGETTKPLIKCEKCEAVNECEINIKDISPQFSEGHRKVIPLVADISVVMRYPTLDDINSIPEGSDVDRTFALITKCLDRINQGETVYNCSEMEEKEVRGFIDEMTQDQFRKLFEFLDTMPKMEKTVAFACKSCNHPNEHTLRGIASFFS